MDLGSTHLLNESQINNVETTRKTTTKTTTTTTGNMVNGSNNMNSSSSNSVSNNTNNGVNANVVTGVANGSGTTAVRPNMDFGDNFNSKNHERKRQKSKLSPPNLNHHYGNNSNSNGNNGSNNQINSHYNQPVYPKTMDDWLSGNNNNSNHINSNGGGYQQKSLDEWLNATMKDSPKTFSVSSTEFLDGPRIGPMGISSNGIGSAAAPQVNPFRTMLDFQTQNTFPNANNCEVPPYFQASNFAATSAAFKLPNHPYDFTSLPPGVNLNIDSNQSGSQNDLLDGLGNRRFSDPCLAGNSDDETPPDRRDKINMKNQSDNNKLLSTLIQQINILHDTNSKICRNLNDTKVDIEALKHAPSWGLRHRRDSISGFSTHSQPMGYPFGTHSPAPTYHSGMYTPGMMTDVVREVKEAARVREEALLSRVRAMVEERSWTMNETHLKMMRDLEEMKIQINQLKTEKFETKNHITKLEEEIKSLRTMLSHTLNYGRMNAAPIDATPAQSPAMNAPFIGDRGFIRQRSGPIPNRSSSANDRQKRHSFCLNYGTINQDDGPVGTPYQAESDLLQPMHDQFNELLKGENINYANSGQQQHNGIYADSTENDIHDGTIVQMEKDNLELRRELQDALATKKQADKKIQNLENLVKSLQTKSQSSVTDNNNVITISTAHSSARTNNTNNTIDTKSTIKPQIATTIQTTAPKVMTTSNGTSTINLTGPVTDL